MYNKQKFFILYKIHSFLFLLLPALLYPSEQPKTELSTVSSLSSQSSTHVPTPSSESSLTAPVVAEQIDAGDNKTEAVSLRSGLSRAAPAPISTTLKDSATKTPPLPQRLKASHSTDPLTTASSSSSSSSGSSSPAPTAGAVANQALAKTISLESQMNICLGRHEAIRMHDAAIAAHQSSITQLEAAIHETPTALAKNTTFINTLLNNEEFMSALFQKLGTKLKVHVHNCVSRSIYRLYTEPGFWDKVTLAATFQEEDDKKINK